MTRDEWLQIQVRLAFPGAKVTLQCDQYKVDLLVYEDKMRMRIGVFVDGFMRREHVTEDCEERRRFMRPVIKKPRAFTAKELREFGKRWCAKYVKDRTYTQYRHDWTSVPSLRRHFTKHNQDIMWVRDAGLIVARPKVADDGRSAEMVTTVIPVEEESKVPNAYPS